jgi:hypothetical protein
VSVSLFFLPDSALHSSLLLRKTPPPSQVSLRDSASSVPLRYLFPSSFLSTFNF